MGVFYVTFGKGKEVEKFEASSQKEAVKQVKEKYGRDWDTVYTEKEYKEVKGE